MPAAPAIIDLDCPSLARPRPSSICAGGKLDAIGIDVKISIPMASQCALHGCPAAHVAIPHINTEMVVKIAVLSRAATRCIAASQIGRASCRERVCQYG